MTFDGVNGKMSVIKTKIAHGGRIVIPAEMRKRYGMPVGGTVHLMDGEDGLVISTPEIALRRLQKKFAGIVPKGVSLVDELIAERRKEAANE